MMYRYQEYGDNIHNFDDIRPFFFDCLTTITSVGKVCVLSCLIAAFRRE